MEYAVTAWDPHRHNPINNIEPVQSRTARYIMQDFIPTTSASGLVSRPKLKPVHGHRKSAKGHTDGKKNKAKAKQQQVSRAAAEKRDASKADGAQVQTSGQGPPQGQGPKDAKADAAQVQTSGQGPPQGQGPKDAAKADGAQVQTSGQGPPQGQGPKDAAKADGAQVQTSGQGPPQGQGPQEETLQESAPEAQVIPKEKKKKKGGKTHGGVDVDGKGTNIIDDLLQGAVGGAAEAPEEEKGTETKGAENLAEKATEMEKGEFDDNFVDLMVELCEARYKATAQNVPSTITVGEDVKVQVKVLGLEEESRKTATQQFIIERVKQLEPLEQVAVLERLWGMEYREFQYLAIDILTDVIISLSRDCGFDEVFRLLRLFITTKSGEDTVDSLAKCHLNGLAFLEPPDTWPVMEEWIEEDDQPWLQRAALMHQVCLGKYTNEEKLFRFCKRFFQMDSETPDFLVKWGGVKAALTNYALKANDEPLNVTPTNKSTIKATEFLKDNMDQMSEFLRGYAEQLENNLEDINKKQRETHRKHLQQRMRAGRRR
ncbi:uncharacterized protein LOC143296563 [Babylonia areolata]|uniref:uncharacterized protein LOC143296563 n=1 Tax=Babylonia areolata TaxID=304850 RepID=UPI003FD0A8DA